MTSMPFYKNRPEKVKITKDHASMLKAYVELFTNHHDEEFAIKTIKSLNKNQAQLLRKVAPKIGIKKEIWEHAIPAKVIVDEIITMIKSKDLAMLDKLINVYQKAGQRALTKKKTNYCLITKVVCLMGGTGEMKMLTYLQDIQ